MHRTNGDIPAWAVQGEELPGRLGRLLLPLLLLCLLVPVMGQDQGSAYQQLHAGVQVVNLMPCYRQNKPPFLISACNFHFVSPEHVCSILASLLRNLRGQQRTRLLNKFTENDSEKVSAPCVSAGWGCRFGRILGTSRMTLCTQRATEKPRGTCCRDSHSHLWCYPEAGGLEVPLALGLPHPRGFCFLLHTAVVMLSPGLCLCCRLMM